MDIRTLLTETKAFPQRKKSASVSPISSPTDTTSTKSASTPSSATDMSAPCMSLMPPMTTASKKVKFTLNSEEAIGTPSFELTISPTDPPNAITATVKDFFALHNCGISFTDVNGSILIITPANLTDDMEVLVNQTNVTEGRAEKRKKNRKSTLSSRKKTRKMGVDSDGDGEENDLMEVDEQDMDQQDQDQQDMDHQDKRERILSSDVSIDNILEYTSRRRLTKFSSEVSPSTLVNSRVFL